MGRRRNRPHGAARRGERGDQPYVGMGAAVSAPPGNGYMGAPKRRAKVHGRPSAGIRVPGRTERDLQDIRDRPWLRPPRNRNVVRPDNHARSRKDGTTPVSEDRLGDGKDRAIIHLASSKADREREGARQRGGYIRSSSAADRRGEDAQGQTITVRKKMVV